jgi:tetratricopeptide (TPR) repeat protein
MNGFPFHRLFKTAAAGRLLLLLLCLVSWSPRPLPAQESRIFAYVQHAGGKKAAQPGRSHKYRVARAVFDELLSARGDLRLPAPELVLNDGEQFIAWMEPERAAIGLEEKAYDVCAGFGADSLDALATLLAHELTHYYEKHDWKRHFVRANRTSESIRVTESPEEGLQQEAQADYLGGFLAFSAGYQVYGLMPRLLPRLYRSYGLPEQIAGYPSLTERLQMAENAMAQLRDLQTVFELAQHLSVLGQYEDAARYYGFILQTFQSREIYNNAGVNLLLAASELFSAREMPYALPVELDPDSRLYGLKSIDPFRMERRQALLGQALEHFDRAVQLDARYAPAHLNKACLYTLQGNWDEAEYWIKKARKIRQDPALQALEGVMAALQNQPEAARAHLSAAVAAGFFPAQRNLEILSGSPTAPTAPRLAAKGVERINQFDLGEFLESPQVDKEIEVSPAIRCGGRDRADSRILLHYADRGSRYAVVQMAADGSAAVSLGGIGAGSGQSELLNAYGPPARTVPQPDGAVWVYAVERLLFRLDARGNVKNWGVFRLSPE